MSWFVYILDCADGSYYTGICYNLKQRISEHNNGSYKRAYTRSKLPVKVVYWEKFDNRFESASREKVIKGWSRVKKRVLIDSLRRVKRDGE